jgi:hypothetical protein
MVPISNFQRGDAELLDAVERPDRTHRGCSLSARTQRSTQPLPSARGQRLDSRRSRGSGLDRGLDCLFLPPADLSPLYDDPSTLANLLTLSTRRGCTSIPVCRAPEPHRPSKLQGRQ